MCLHACWNQAPREKPLLVSDPITVDRLSPRITRAEERSNPTPASLAEHEKELIELHLRQSEGNRTRAARSLGISREGLRKKMKRLGLA